MSNLYTRLEELSTQFRTGINNNFRVFGRHAFRKHTGSNDSRSVLNASLWDVMSTGLSRYPESLVETSCDALKAAFFSLMMDDDFIKAVTYASNDTGRVRHRFSVVEKMFEEVFGAHAT